MDAHMTHISNIPQDAQDILFAVKAEELMKRVLRQAFSVQP